MTSIWIEGVRIPLWLLGTVAALIIAAVVAFAVMRRRQRFQRQFGRAVAGITAVQMSIHPPAERIHDPNGR